MVVLGSQNRKKESRIVVAKRQRKEKASENRTKEGPRTRVRPSGKTNSPPGQPNLHRADSGGGEIKHIKRGAKIEPVASLLLASFGLAHSQFSCLENPMDGGAWQAAVHEVAGSWTQLGDFTLTVHFHALEKEMATHSSVLAWRITDGGAWGAAVYGVTQSRT